MHRLLAGLTGAALAMTIAGAALAQATLIPAPGQQPLRTASQDTTPPAAPGETLWQRQHREFGAIDPAKMTCAEFAQANGNDRAHVVALLTDRAHEAGGDLGIGRHFVPVPLAEVTGACHSHPDRQVSAIVSAKVTGTM